MRVLSILVSPLLFAVVLLGSACRETMQEPRDTLVVASDLDNAPFAYVDDGGRPAGRDVEMMERIASDLGLRLVWNRVPFDELFTCLEAGEADLICATLGVTPERGQRVEFTYPYYRTGIAVLVRTGEDEPQTAADLSGKRVAAGRGTTSELALDRAQTGAFQVLDNRKGLPSAERLRGREVDAVVMDRPNAIALAAASDGELRVFDDDLAEENYALALPRGGLHMRNLINRSLEALEREGWFAELDARYGL